MLPKFTIVLWSLIVFAILNTFLLGAQISSSSQQPSATGVNSTYQNAGPSGVISSSPLSALKENSLVLAPLSWAAVVGVWVWRGRIRSEWNRNGLSQEVFKLMVKMKGRQNRISILKELSTPRDRLQLAEGLGLDWKTVDHHVHILLKYGLIHEKSAFGNVKLYELTGLGTLLLNMLEEFDSPESADFGGSKA